MKRFLFAVVFLIGCHVVAPVPSQAATVNVQISYDYTVDKACTAGQVKDCVSGFQVGEWSGTACSNLATVPNAATPVGPATSAGTFKVGAPYTNVTFCAVATYFDTNGVAKTTAATQASPVAVAPGQVITLALNLS